MGISGWFGATVGAPMAVGVQHLPFRLRGGREEKKLLYVRMFIWEGCIPASKGRQSKM